jgi:hypothetical protein
MARPDLISSDVGAANCDHFLGAMVVTVAALSTAEVTRIARYLNVPLGVVLIIGGLCFASHSPVVVASDLICGIALICAAHPGTDLCGKADRIFALL